MITKAKALSERIKTSRRKMLGEVILQNDTNPAIKSPLFAQKAQQMYKSRLGKPRTNLFDTLKKDLASAGLRLEDQNDLDILRNISKKEWEQMTNLKLG